MMAKASTMGQATWGKYDREKRIPGNKRWGRQKRSQNTLYLYLNCKQWVDLQPVGDMAPYLSGRMVWKE